MKNKTKIQLNSTRMGDTFRELTTAQKKLEELEALKLKLEETVQRREEQIMSLFSYIQASSK